MRQFSSRIADARHSFTRVVGFSHSTTPGFFAECLGKVLPSMILARTPALIWLAGSILCARVIFPAATPHA
jgi:hypothetical protein